MNFTIDPEFKRSGLREVLKSRNIIIQESPSGSSSKNVKINPTNDLFKTIVDCLSKVNTRESDRELVERASFSYKYVSRQFHP